MQSQEWELHHDAPIHCRCRALCRDCRRRFFLRNAVARVGLASITLFALLGA
jgi:hypothetical protein